MTVLPHDINAEKSVLGVILIDNNALDSLQESEVEAKDFYLNSHQKIFEMICDLAAKNQSIDLVLITSALRDRGCYDEVGGIGTLTGLFDQASFSISNVKQYGKVIRKLSIQRNIIKTCSEIMEEGLNGVENIDEYINSAESKIFQVTRTKNKSSIKRLPDVVSENMLKLQDLFVAGGKTVVGLETGFTDFDHLTTGLYSGQVMVLAARPGMGKTAWFLSAILHAGVVQGKVAALFSLEMTAEELGGRICSAMCRIDLKRLKTGALSRDEFKKLMHASDQMTKTKIFIDDTAGPTIMDIRSNCRRIVSMAGRIDLVVIDYLQLMRGPKTNSNNANREQEISAISRGLKELAKELKVPVIALSQLNRQGQNREDKRPVLSDLRESGAIEQDADLVCFIHREDYYNRDTDDKGIAELIVAKNRNGESDTIKLGWLGQYTLFTNLATKENGEHR